MGIVGSFYLQFAIRPSDTRFLAPPHPKKTLLACDVPPKTQQKFECFNSYWFTCTGGRWYVHACETRILTSRPKLFASIGYHIFLLMVPRGAILAGAISSRTMKEYNRQRKLWGWVFLGWCRLCAETQLCDYMTRILKGNGRGGFYRARKDAKVGWLW